MLSSLEFYQEEFEKHLMQKSILKEPKNLYEPIQYILNIGGKRLRPLLTLMSCEAFGKSYKSAMDAALAVEMFHNFSLIHDDIMDAAPLRRGHMTVHEKWDTNVGILSGDLMLISAYQHFENYEPQIFQKLAKLFSQTAVKVCEGQQFDVDYEVSEDVTIAQYLKMIEYKTAVLLGAAMEMGAIVAGVSGKSQSAIYEFGRHLGLAFQLQDDYLDVFGDPETFGKQLGGDIISNKKTYLYLKARQDLSIEKSRELEHLYSIQPENPAEKIEAVKRLFESSGAQEKTKNKIKNYTIVAIDLLNELEISESDRKELTDFANHLIYRTI